jgi:hypothetical protein
MEGRNRGVLLILLFLFLGGGVLEAQMDAYFTAINHPVPQDTMMVMLLSDFQSARSTDDFFTGMSMVQYGITPIKRWWTIRRNESDSVPYSKRAIPEEVPCTDMVWKGGTWVGCGYSGWC